MTLRERWDRRDWLILAGLLAGVGVVRTKVLFTRGWSFGVEVDFLRQFYPARFFAARSLAGGTFPLWNPYVLLGQPFFASYQTAMLYPFNLLMVGLYGAAGADLTLRAVSGFVVFHFWLAGVFTYLLARDIKIGRAGATVAALTFMFSGFMTAHAGHLNQQSAAAWISAHIPAVQPVASQAAPLVRRGRRGGDGRGPARRAPAAHLLPGGGPGRAGDPDRHPARPG